MRREMEVIPVVLNVCFALPVWRVLLVLHQISTLTMFQRHHTSEKVPINLSGYPRPIRPMG